MPNPTPAYTLEECAAQLERILLHFGGTDVEQAILHHLRAAQADAAALAILQRESATREREVRAEERERCAKVCEDQMPDVGTHGCATAIRAGVECVPLIFAQEKAWEEGYRSGWQDGFGKRAEKRENPYRSGT